MSTFVFIFVFPECIKTCEHRWDKWEIKIAYSVNRWAARCIISLKFMFRMPTIAQTIKYTNKYSNKSNKWMHLFWQSLASSAIFSSHFINILIFSLSLLLFRTAFMWGKILATDFQLVNGNQFHNAKIIIY